MRPVTVVGSGASGVHFALTLLRKGHEVTMLDVGYPPTKAGNPEATLDDLKERLADPAGYFLGPRFDGVLLPEDDAEYYGIPPSKGYVFEHPDGFEVAAEGFEPLFSFARGGLAQAWTAGCYPLNDAELADFPWGYGELGPHYDEVAGRIGVTGAADDLARFMPVHDNLLEPLDLDEHSRALVRRYERKKAVLNRELGCWIGRTRVATLSRDAGSRRACAYLGRCLWGCPVEALYTPSQTLEECSRSSRFDYRPGLEVLFFRFDEGRRIREIVARDVASRERVAVPVEHLALAAGTLPTTKIVLRSIYEDSGELPRIPGLMDNRQVLLPFVNLGMIGRQFSARSYQYHLLGMGLEAERPSEYVHGQITTLKTALLHPIIQKIPLDLRAAAAVARAVHAALGVVNVNFHDSRRESNHLRLEAGGEEPQLMVSYRPPSDEAERMAPALRRVRRALGKLGCIVPPGMAHTRPMGSSVHYAGTFPMGRNAGRWSTDADCRSREFGNLYLVDGSTYPFLPAKNLTFTLMANAARVAARAF